MESSTEKGGISVSSVANELGENDSVIETEVAIDGKVTLNSRFLLDALNAAEEKKVVMEFSSKLTPAVIKNQTLTGYTHIIMPLKS